MRCNLSKHGPVNLSRLAFENPQNSSELFCSCVKEASGCGLLLVPFLVLWIFKYKFSKLQGRIKIPVWKWHKNMW